MSIAERWRHVYNIPPNDPRFLSMTEEGMLEDLLIRMHHSAEMRRAMNPGKADVDTIAADPELQRSMVESGTAYTRKPSVRRGIAKMLGKLKPPAARLPVRISLNPSTRGPGRER